jgi:hypothetical protein
MKVSLLTEIMVNKTTQCNESKWYGTLYNKHRQVLPSMFLSLSSLQFANKQLSVKVCYYSEFLYFLSFQAHFATAHLIWRRSRHIWTNANLNKCRPKSSFSSCTLDNVYTEQSELRMNWGFSSSEMWHCVAGLVWLKVLKMHSAFIFQGWCVQGMHARGASGSDNIYQIK